MVIEGQRVHIWRISLGLPPLSAQVFNHILSDDERDRCRRFHFERDRQHFAIARGALRGILSRYVGLEPSALRFCYGPNGKPSLDGGSNPGPVRFNLSHSGEIAVVAVTSGLEVGIDVEHMRPDFACAEVAERFFSRQEFGDFLKLPESLRVTAFFNCWTRKEAFVKAKGGGLSIPLDQFDVSLTPGEESALLRTRWDAYEAAQWALYAFDVEQGYASALAVKGQQHAHQLEFWEYGNGYS
jgi:4'-phosphopantetheinyl transferase